MMLNEKILEFIKFFHDGVISAPYALGIKLTQAALEYLKIGVPKFNELLVISETRHCFIDGIQVIAKTTFGCGQLIIKEYGKLAFTMVDKKTGNAVRVSLTPEFQREMTNFSNKIRGLFKKHEEEKILRLSMDFGDIIMKMNYKDLCVIKKVTITDNSILENANIKHQEFNCEKCGEGILDYAIYKINNQILCPTCANIDVYYEIIN